MIIRYLGHAAFLIISQNGTEIITDPYNSTGYGQNFQYMVIQEQADIVTVSHGHEDHNYKGINGDPVYLRDAGKREIKSVLLNGIPTFHDDKKGKIRGNNIIFTIEVDSVRLVHLGDLGHVLTSDDIKKIGPVDILFIPVGGTYTIGPETADQVIDSLKPRIVIPMHYKTDKCSFPIFPVDAFLKNKKYEHIEGDLEITKDRLPKTSVIYLLDYTQ
jgi:L-ascorbate metabolism protein UlaG (beta-lactamase superfamily)